MWGVSLTHPVLASFLSGEFLLHIPDFFFFFFFFASLKKNLGCFSYTSRAGFIFMWGVSLTHPEFWGFSFTHPMLVSPLSGEFLLYIPCWFHFHVGSFSYTPTPPPPPPPPRACFLFICGVSLTHPKLLLYFFREFSYTSHSEFIFYLGSFSYTSHAGFFS